MSTTTKLLAALMLLAFGLALAPARAQADVLADVRALFDQQKEEDDPFLPVHDYYVKQAQQAENQGELTTALEYYRIAATIDRRDRESTTSARNLLAELSKKAKALYEEGVALFEKGDAEGARTRLLEALRLFPDNTKPLDYLKDKMLVQPEDHYVIEEGDTLRRVSEKIYDNPGGELLLTRINQLSIADHLKPGDTLLVPKVPAVLSKRLVLAEAEPVPVAAAPAKTQRQTASLTQPEAAPAPAPEAVAQEQAITQSQGSGTDALLAMAQLQFGNGLYETAVSMTDEILSADPNNAAAKDIQDESYYRMGQSLWEKGSATEAMRALRRLPDNYKDSASLRNEVQKKLDADSEPLYLAGVRYFLNEDLENAVEQWQLALEVNPYHAKARADLEKARKLLEAVKGL